MPLFNRDANDNTPTTPGTIPLPPIGGDKWSWIRWGITVALLIAGLWLGNLQGVKLDAQAHEIKALKAEMASRPITVTEKK